MRVHTGILTVVVEIPRVSGGLVVMFESRRISRHQKIVCAIENPVLAQLEWSHGAKLFPCVLGKDDWEL